VLTLAAGALFGLWKGTLIVSFASSIGALAAFLTARYLLREAVQRRFAERLEVIDAGIERDGALYLFSLRMVPIFPFFLINLAMGLTAIRAWTFYWVSQLGMLAGTMVYVNAGRQLASLQSLSGILSPPLWASFALLGIFPWLAKTAVTWVQRKHRYAPWSRPKRFDRNLIVIGGGAAGLVTAYIAAATKATVTLVERRSMGGDCLNHGCVPSKALIAAANLAHRIRHADRLGIACREPRIHFPTVVEHIRTAIERVAPHDSVERYTALGVDVRLGHARLLDPWTVEITAADGAQERLTPAASCWPPGQNRSCPRCQVSRRRDTSPRKPSGIFSPNAPSLPDASWCWAAAPSAASSPKPSPGWEAMSRRWSAAG
jgi:membrane protein DedA with SNARE-associated domain